MFMRIVVRGAPEAPDLRSSANKKNIGHFLKCKFTGRLQGRRCDMVSGSFIIFGLPTNDSLVRGVLFLVMISSVN